MTDRLPTTGLQRAVREIVSRELREGLALHFPPPVSMGPAQIASEQLVLCALVKGQARLRDVPLKPEDFFIPLHRYAFAAFLVLNGKPITTVGLIAAMKAVGAHGDPERLAEEVLELSVADELLEQIGDGAVSDLRTHVELIAEASRARALLRWMERISDDLRNGRITAAEARSRLRPDPPANVLAPKSGPVHPSQRLPADTKRTA